MLTSDTLVTMNHSWSKSRGDLGELIWSPTPLQGTAFGTPYLESPSVKSSIHPSRVQFEPRLGLLCFGGILATPSVFLFTLECKFMDADK